MKGFRGFTLVELMVVLAIIGVLLMLSAPFGRFVNDNSASYNAREFVTSLNLARSTAISSGAPVVICRLEVVDETTGEQDCWVDGQAGNKSWQGGWAMFIDANGDNSITNGTIGGPDADNDGIPDSAVDDDQFVQMHGALPNGYTLTSQSEQIGFSPMGLVSGLPTTWILCTPSNDVTLARAIILARTGRVRFAEDSDNDGVRELADGTDITCV